MRLPACSQRRAGGRIAASTRRCTGLLRGSFAISRVVQRGRLEIYMAVTFVVIALALLLPLALFGEWPRLAGLAGAVAVHEWAVLAIAVVGLAAVLRANNRLTAIVSLGIQGFAVALLFLLLGAPDLSFTQFMVETLSVVILALVMTRLRLSPADRRPPLARLVDGVDRRRLPAPVSACCCCKATQLPFDARLSDFFSAHSKVDRPRPQHRQRHHRRFPRARHAGRDRGRDDRRPGDPGADPHDERPRGAPGDGRIAMRTLIFRTIAPALTSLMLLFSVFVLLRGHNDPGGGFIGGLIAVSAIAIYGIAFGVAAARRALHFHPLAIAGAGLLLSAASGLPSLAERRSVPDRHLDHRAAVRRIGRPVDGDGVRHRRLSGRRRLAVLGRPGARRPGGRLNGNRALRPCRPVLHRRDLPDAVEAHHQDAARHRAVRQCGEPADLHGRPHAEQDSADHRAKGFPFPPARPPIRCRRR